MNKYGHLSNDQARLVAAELQIQAARLRQMAEAEAKREAESVARDWSETSRAHYGGARTALAWAAEILEADATEAREIYEPQEDAQQ